MTLAVLLLGACSGEQLGGKPSNPDGAQPTGPGAIPIPIDASVPPGLTDASTTPVYSAACWAGSLPAATQPILPTTLTVTACGAGFGSAWSYPQDPAGAGADDRRYIVGRWQTCNNGIDGVPRHEAIEFGANGRWRLLTYYTSDNPLIDVLYPLSGSGTSGYYYLLGDGQLDMTGEDPGTGGGSFSIAFVGMDSLQFNSAGSSFAPVYARLDPSPLNGADNPPSTAAGGCSMVGDWDVPADTGPPGAPASVFSFDAAGNFVVGPAGANLCDGHTGYGTYALSNGMFQLTSNVGLGLCQWWFTGGFPATFDASCNQLSLTREWDNCTGGRGYFNDPTTLTRRLAAAGDAGASTHLGAAVPPP
jgi:hypothetical protein